MRCSGRLKTGDSSARARDRGAVLVESAIVLPVLFALIFGVLETGILVRTYSATSNAARSGGREASVAGNDSLADQLILRRIQAESAGLPKAEIEYIVVWRSTGPGTAAGAGSPPLACIPAIRPAPNSTSEGVRVGAGAEGSCNIYFRPGDPGGGFAMADPSTTDGAAQPPAYYFGCTDGTGTDVNRVDCRWRPKERHVTKSPRGSGGTTTSDYLGVYIRVSHRSATRVLGGSFAITDSSVALLEPQGYAP